MDRVSGQTTSDTQQQTNLGLHVCAVVSLRPLNLLPVKFLSTLQTK